MYRLIVLLVMCMLMQVGYSAPTDSHKATSDLPSGVTKIDWQWRLANGTKQIPLWIYKPSSCSTDCRMHMVFHGVRRNASDYLRHWIAIADRQKLIIIAPEFTQEQFPGDKAYNLGNVLTTSNEQEWTFSAPDLIFEFVRTSFALTTIGYSVFGHSAGGQFVHRWHLLKPSQYAHTVIAANPGWYTMPIFANQTNFGTFPFTWVDIPVPKDRLLQAFSRPFILMLGDQDIDANHPALNKSAFANAQGVNRFERGNRFFEASEQAALAAQVAFNWRKIIVPNVAHDDAAMAQAAAQLIR